MGDHADVLLAFAVARLFPNLLSNALEPGWVPTKMGGPGAPDDLDAEVAAELAELEALAEAMSEDEVEGLPPVAGPQDWE